MSKQFKVYFKDGKVVQLELNRFTLDNQKIILFDKDNSNDTSHFLPVSTVAAIIPNEPDKTERPEQFKIYLKKHKAPVEITAYEFEIDDSSEIKFMCVNYSNRKYPVRDIYIDYSEVLAIFPVNTYAVTDVSTDSTI